MHTHTHTVDAQACNWPEGTFNHESWKLDCQAFLLGQLFCNKISPGLFTCTGSHWVPESFGGFWLRFVPATKFQHTKVQKDSPLLFDCKDSRLNIVVRVATVGCREKCTAQQYKSWIGNILSLYLDSPSDPNQKWVHDPILGNVQPFFKGP